MVFGAYHWLIPIFGVSLVLIGFFLFVEWKKSLWRREIFSREQGNFLFGKEFDWYRFFHIFSVSMATLLLAFVLLDPRWGLVQRTERIEGVDVVLVLDVSQSMLCEDVGESRLQRARQIIFDLMARGGNHRLGLVMFAADAYTVVPLTFDYEVISLWIQEANPLMIEHQGSNLERGIAEALKLFEKNTLSHRVIVVLSDGEDMEHQPLRMVSHASQQGIMIVSIGIGTTVGGKIPLRDERGNLKGFLSQNGQEIVTRLQEDILLELAKKTGGTYIEATRLAGGDLVHFLEKMKKNPYGKMSYEMLKAQYQFFLLPALLLWFLALLSVSMRNVAMLFFLVIVFSLPVSSYAGEASRGTTMYQKHQYEEARQAFQRALVKNPRSLKLRYNLGNTFYQTGEYEKAAVEFCGLTNVDNQELSLRSLYNMSTSLASLGEKEEAVQAYRHLLQRIDSRHPLYQKTIENLLYLQQPSQKQSHFSSGNQSPSHHQQNPSQQKNSSQEKDRRPQNQDNQALLNLVQQEERKNMQKIPLSGGERRSRYPW